MFKRLKENEKGLTLIELLVVIVILGIIAAIAVIAIGGIIDNSKKDAHISNAKQMANAAKLYMAAEDQAEGTVTLNELIEGNYMEETKDPSVKKGKYSGNSSVEVTRGTNKFMYKVTLISGDDETTYLSGNAVDLDRSSVTLP